MKIRKFGMACALIICWLGGAISGAQELGKIMGIVVDENCVPVIAAKVSVDRADQTQFHSLLRSIDTDSAGRFVIGRLAFGQYKVFAKQEQLGYPDTRWSFYSGDVFAHATVNSTHPTADVQIKIGPKAGLLTGSVSDALSGAPVPAAFKLTRVDAPNDWISTSMPPSYRVLLPPATRVRLEVSAPGFKAWAYPDTLRLQSGIERRLDIALEPSHDRNLHGSRFLVPAGYIGWLLLEYHVPSAEAVPMKSGEPTFKFPPSGKLNTSSEGPQSGAQDVYLFYSPDGSIRPIPTDYRGGSSMIWGQYVGTRQGILCEFGFFVGSEEQYKKYQSLKTRPGPIQEYPRN